MSRKRSRWLGLDDDGFTLVGVCRHEGCPWRTQCATRDDVLARYALHHDAEHSMSAVAVKRWAREHGGTS